MIEPRDEYDQIVEIMNNVGYDIVGSKLMDRLRQLMGKIGGLFGGAGGSGSGNGGSVTISAGGGGGIGVVNGGSITVQGCTIQNGTGITVQSGGVGWGGSGMLPVCNGGTGLTNQGASMCQSSQSVTLPVSNISTGTSFTISNQSSLPITLHL